MKLPVVLSEYSQPRVVLSIEHLQCLKTNMTAVRIKLLVSLI